MVGILRICADDVEPPQMLSHALYTCLFITQSDICQIPFLLCFYCCFCCGICWIPPTGRWVNKATPDSGDYTLKSSCKVKRAPGWYLGHVNVTFGGLHLKSNRKIKQIHPRRLRQIILERWVKGEGHSWMARSIHRTLGGQWLYMS